MWVEIDTADEGSFSINQPAFLMLTETGMGTVPTALDIRSAALELPALFERSPECVAAEMRCLVARSPKHNPDIDPAIRCALQDIKRSSASVRHPKICPHKRDGHPDCPLRGVDQCTNSPKRRLTIDPRTEFVPISDRIGASNADPARLKAHRAGEQRWVDKRPELAAPGLQTVRSQPRPIGQRSPVTRLMPGDPP